MSSINDLSREDFIKIRNTLVKVMDRGHHDEMRSELLLTSGFIDISAVLNEEERPF